jgi:hypothetical protein
VRSRPGATACPAKPPRGIARAGQAEIDEVDRRDLAAQLPLTLAFRDFNIVEKIAPLPRELSLDGAPAGDDPAVGDIGYWAPGGDLVFYYGDVGF